MRRRSLLLAAALPGCSVLPNRPYVETRLFPLDPQRPPGPPPAVAGRPLLLRSLRTAPGLETRSLRRVRADGTLDLAFYAEWVALPADLTEAALRAWLAASGMFTAVTAPGSRLPAPLVLEAELTTLEARPSQRQARAGLGALLLAEREAGGELRPAGQWVAEGSAPITGAPDSADAQAAAMVAALGAAFERIEAGLVRHIPAEPARNRR
ncbi:MAG: ABC-type transport auxiliary lipoprotein family protein [Acetobacteraceae bacterium]|nr:ABC-type transport auxiliary lipoprotein family protein [Acetobacteraceae bacterium]